MGQAKAKKTTTQQFVARYPECCFCAGERPSVEREHMPPKALFDSAHRPDKLVMPSCRECNGGTSSADLVAAIIGRWGEFSLLNDDHAKLVNRARRQAPDVVNEWMKDLDDIQIRGRRHLRREGVPVPFGAKVVYIGTSTIRQLNVFAHKTALALYFEHFKKPLSKNGRFWASWRTKEDYLGQGLPKSILQLLPNYKTLIQGQWNAHKTFEYRYSENLEQGLFGFFARLRHGLFILGCAAENEGLIAAQDSDWIKGGCLLELSNSPCFQDRL